jgi:hypothetical protein
VDTPKVPKREFDAVLTALLKASPMPLAGISPKKPKARRAKKRGQP